MFKIEFLLKIEFFCNANEMCSYFTKIVYTYQSFYILVTCKAIMVRPLGVMYLYSYICVNLTTTRL